MEQLTQKRLQELFTYEADTGIFIRKSTGKEAVSKHNGYIRIYIDYKEYMKTKEEYEEKLKVVSGLASILDDPFFNDEV